MEYRDYQRRYILRLKKELVKSHGGECVRCSSTGNLQFAHREKSGVSGRSRGQKKRLLDVRRNPDSYLLLCSYCHGEFDGVAVLKTGLKL
jgi:hypothetical protein